MGDYLIGAFALMLVLEGLLPFFSPSAWRRMFERALKLSDNQIRLVGLSAMIFGLLMLAWWR